ncbi:DUF4123 domain-containing protein [Candidatus Thiosymbion oneisti]|uniref:DUF4123 domain-containing protein n=1 Tax=Candidatus Thiosymbion oneisti TaxID=589554 RepID=UPI000A951F46|nr:DUF4123 domain-containing protein [Candidatus Thiosymbion oneisti]
MLFSNPSGQPEQPTRSVGELAARLLEGPGRLFAIADAARDEQVLSVVRKLGIEARCLYTGNEAIRLAAYAPYLLSFNATLHPLSRYLIYSWCRQWGIFLRSRLSAAAISAHFADLMTVRTPEGEAYFRFYDPRVLPEFLSSSTSDMLVKFFGAAIDCFLVEHDDGNTLIQYRIAPLERMPGEHYLTTATFSVQR